MGHWSDSPVRMKPIWGFGTVGWCGVVMLAVLAGGMVLGVDWLFEFQRVVDRWTGIYSGYNRIAIKWHHYYGISLRMPSFGLIGLLYLAIALHLYPRRLSIWALLAVVVWALARPFFVETIVLSIDGWLTRHLPIRPELAGAMALSIAEAPTVLLLGALSRSAFVACVSGLTVVVATGVIPVMLSQFATYNTSGQEWMIWAERGAAGLYHIGVGSSLLWWAVRSRRETLREAGARCMKCGYDVRGIAGAVCPECGTGKAGA